MWSSDQRRREANSLNRQCKLRRSLAYRWLPQAPTVAPSLWLARPSRSDYCAAPLPASVKGCTISAYVAASLRQVRSLVRPANCRFVSSKAKMLLHAPRVTMETQDVDGEERFVTIGSIHQNVQTHGGGLHSEVAR